MCGANRGCGRAQQIWVTRRKWQFTARLALPMQQPFALGGFVMREPTHSKGAKNSIDPKGFQAIRGKRARVLIAEDEWAFRALLIWAFEVEGCDVATVGTGPKLLEVLGTSMMPNSGIEPFDLVVSDVRMPGWSGLPALEDLCHSPVMPPIVVITAFGSAELHHRAEKAGAVAVLDKPFEVGDLTAVGLRAIVKHRHLN